MSPRLQRRFLACVALAAGLTLTSAASAQSESQKSPAQTSESLPAAPSKPKASTDKPASPVSKPIDAATRAAIDANVKLIVERFDGKASLDRDGIAFLDGFIRRMPDTLRAKPGGLVGVIGSHLGTSMVRAYNGRWIQTEGGAVGVRMGPMFEGGTELTAFPFSKVGKHIANGQEDSILSFFLIAERLLKEKASATATQ